MNIEIISVGKLKEKYLKQGIKEYLKRMGPYAKVKLIELADEATGDNMSDREIDLILSKEADRIMPHLSPDRKVIVLAIEGQLVTSEDLAKQLDDYATYGSSKVSFVIGGSLGLHDRVKDRADLLVSLGRITLPHQLSRLVLMEQIYRAYRIIHGHAYHK